MLTRLPFFPFSTPLRPDHPCIRPYTSQVRWSKRQLHRADKLAEAAELRQLAEQQARSCEARDKKGKGREEQPRPPSMPQPAPPLAKGTKRCRRGGKGRKKQKKVEEGAVGGRAPSGLGAYMQVGAVAWGAGAELRDSWGIMDAGQLFNLTFFGGEGVFLLFSLLPSQY